MSKRLIDLSHTIEDGLVTYPGLPAPRVSAHWTYEESREHYTGDTEFRVGKLELVGNTGTYLDAPSHRFAGAMDLAQLPLEKLVDLEGLVVRVDGVQGRAIEASQLQSLEVSGKAVLVHTGWSRGFGSPAYSQGHPYLTEDAAKYLADNRAALVGIDSLNIDDTDDPRRPAHTTLLRQEIPVVEHLTNLNALPEHGFRFSAVPVKIKGMDSFPVRAYARLD